jgi:DNA-binding response OmpR family regulator
MRAPRNAGVPGMRVAIVGDDPSQAELLGHWLRRGGHHAQHFDRGATVIHALSQNTFDVLVLDWNLRDISGVEVLRRIRGSAQSSLPVLFASARGRQEDVVSALRQGADDYMIKPVRCLEFIARLETIARRDMRRAEQPEVLKLDVYHVDCPSHTLMRDGHPVDLTAKDFELSVLFLRNVGQLLSRGHICERVWGRSEAVTWRTLDTHVSRVRHKLRFMPENGWRLVAKYGYGYRLQQLGVARQYH